MKTTLEIPDDLMRTVKLRAVQENRKLKDMVADLLRLGLSQPAMSAPVRRRVQLPLIQTGQAAPEDELTPARVAQILLDEDVNGITA